MTEQLQLSINMSVAAQHAECDLCHLFCCKIPPPSGPTGTQQQVNVSSVLPHTQFRVTYNNVKYIIQYSSPFPFFKTYFMGLEDAKDPVQI